MKRFFCFLLALCLLLPCLPAAARAQVAGECGDGLEWTFADGTLTVSGTGPMFSYAYQDAPWCLGEMDVRKVILEEGVTGIGSFAFRDCTALETLVLPSTLEAIGQGAFSGCEALAAVSIPEISAWMDVTFDLWYEEIYNPGDNSWKEIQICSNPLGANDSVILYVDGEAATTVTLPEGLTAIGSNCFRDYRNLTTLYLPATVKTVGDYAFTGSGLTDVYYSGIPNQVASIRCGEDRPSLMRAQWHFGEETHVHEFGEWETVTAPSCAKPGTAHRYCDSCDHFETKEIPVTDHGYSDWKTVKASTTGAPGQQRRVCRECAAAETRPIPQTPTVTVSADTASGKPKLTWNAIADADKYRIYRSTSKSGKYAYLATAAEETFTDTSAVAGTNYYYKVRALDSENSLYSGYSPIVNRVCDLARPTVTLSVNTTSGKPVVKWETVEGAAKYSVYRSTTKSSGYKKVYTGVKARSYEDTSAVAGTTYYYKVKAIHVKESANSAYSSVLSRVCDLAKPTVTISLTTKGYPYLKWSQVDGTLRYRIYRSESKSGTYDYIGYTATLKYADKTAEAGTKYYYKVRAVHENSEATSAYSAPKAITAK